MWQSSVLPTFYMNKIAPYETLENPAGTKSHFFFCRQKNRAPKSVFYIKISKIWYNNS